jgi:hypothetical protein
MSPAARKLVLTTHVISSLGWLGSISAFLALAVAGVTSDDAKLVRSVYLVAEPVTWFVIVPMALGSLITGIVQSLGSTWGLFRHYWVLMKLGITVLAAVVLLLYTRTIEYFADLAADPATDLEQLRTSSFVLHSGIALMLLVLATVLAVYKPRGRTRYGWRKQQELRAASPQ